MTLISVILKRDMILPSLGVRLPTVCLGEDPRPEPPVCSAKHAGSAFGGLGMRGKISSATESLLPLLLSRMKIIWEHDSGYVAIVGVTFRIYTMIVDSFKKAATW